jgi:hypothetical protein
MRPMAGRIEQLDESGMLVLDFLKSFSLDEFGISQTPLDVKLGFNGLITNDKFCLTRKRYIILKTDQRP